MKKISQKHSENITFSMLVLSILMFLLACCCFACNTPKQYENVIKEHYHIDNDPDTTSTVSYYTLDLYNVIDLLYDPSSKSYFIDYEDWDVFDLDYLADIDDDREEWDYIVIKLESEEDFIELLKDIQKSPEEQLDITMLEKWIITEVKTPVEGGVNFKYYLTKNPLFSIER